MSLGAEPTAVWRIKDEDHALHVRFDRDGTKECHWRLPGADEWGLDGRKVSTLPHYGSERVKEWAKNAMVVVTEGEKAADALLEVRFCALGTVTGASGTPNTEVLRVLEGFEHLIVQNRGSRKVVHCVRRRR